MTIHIRYLQIYVGQESRCALVGSRFCLLRLLWQRWLGHAWGRVCHTPVLVAKN